MTGPDTIAQTSTTARTEPPDLASLFRDWVTGVEGLAEFEDLGHGIYGCRYQGQPYSIVVAPTADH